MNHTTLLKRAFEIVRRYRVLWLYGILVALTAGNTGGEGGLRYVLDAGDLGRGNWPGWPPHWQLRDLDPAPILSAIMLCCCLLLIAAVVSVILRYVARAALVRGVNHIEETNAGFSWRDGFRLGWSGRTFRLFLLELIVGVLFTVAAVLVLALCASPMLLLLTNSDAGRAIGIGLTVFLGLLGILLLVVAGISVGLLGQFWAREVLLADRGIGEALSGGYALVRHRLKDVGLMWLLMLGVSVGWGIVMVPVVLVLTGLAAALGGGLGYAVYAASNSVAAAAAFGIPVGLLILVVPLCLVQGLYEAFYSGAWTLTYREVAADA